MGAKVTKPTAAAREDKNWVSCSDSSTCNTGWACCKSFSLSYPASVTTAANAVSLCVNPGLAGSQVPSNVVTYGGRFYFCTLADAKAIKTGAQSLAVASAFAVSAACIAL